MTHLSIRQASDICFTSLGLVVLDEIRFPNRAPLNDVLGGSGTYGEVLDYRSNIMTAQLTSAVATLGARLFLPPPSCPTLGWMINVGNDFSDSVKEQLASWGTTSLMKMESTRPSTRGLLEYKDTTFGRM